MGPSSVVRFAISGRVPSLNARWKQAKGGGRYKDPATTAWEERFASHALAARPPSWRLDGTYRLELTVVGSNADIDNIVKACGDAGEGIVWTNDKQILSLNVHLVRANVPEPSLLVRVTPQGF